MIRDLTSTVLLAAFVTAFFAGAHRAHADDALMEIVGGNSAAVTLEPAQEAPGSFGFPVLLKGGARPVVHVDLVRARLDDQPADIKGYRACLARPSAGRSLWDLRIDSANEPFADGKHVVTVMAWSDENTTASATVCGTGQRGAPPPATCPGDGCATFDITIEIDRQTEPARKGDLLTVIGPDEPILPFDAGGKPGSISYAFAPGEGVDANALWLFPVATTSSVPSVHKGFSACIQPGDPNSEIPAIVVRPDGDEYRPATYEHTLYAVLSDGKGLLCEGAGTPPEFPHSGACLPAAEADKELVCQSITLKIVRKPGKLQAPGEIAINIERFPFAELAEYLDRGDNGGPGSWDLRRHHTPIRIRETGDEGAVDLGGTELAIAVAGKDDPTRSGTVSFRPVGVPPNKAADLALMGPGGSIELEPEQYDLPNGFGAYSGKLRLTPAVATAEAREVPVTVTVHMSVYALGLAILAGIYVGYRYRLRFERGIPRDKALMEARRVLDRLLRHRDSARDRDLIQALETAIAELRSEMFAVETTEKSITDAVKAAEDALKAALDKLAADSAEAAKKLDPWDAGLMASSAEPAEIQQAFSAVRRRVDALRELLNDGDVARVNNAEDGLASLPGMAKAALEQTRNWLEVNKSPMQRTAAQWSVLRQSLAQTGRDMETAETAIATAIGDPVTAAKTGTARDALETVLRSYDIVFRRLLLHDVERFVLELAENAGAHGINTSDMRALVQSLATAANNPNTAWPIATFADRAERLFKAVARCANDLIEKGALGPSTEREEDAQAVDRAIAAWKTGGFGGPESAFEEAADDYRTVAVAPAHRIVPPPVVYQHEPQLWRLEVGNAETAMPREVRWTVGDEEVATGVRAYLTINAPDSVSVTVTTDDGTSTLQAHASPVETPGPTDMAALHARIVSEIRHRTLWNGILITIFGVAVLGTFAAGYPGLVAAFAWGLAADLSADKLATVLGRAPKA